MMHVSYFKVDFSVIKIVSLLQIQYETTTFFSSVLNCDLIRSCETHFYSLFSPNTLQLPSPSWTACWNSSWNWISSTNYQGDFTIFYEPLLFIFLISTYILYVFVMLTNFMTIKCWQLWFKSWVQAHKTLKFINNCILLKEMKEFLLLSENSSELTYVQMKNLEMENERVVIHALHIEYHQASILHST